MRLQGLLAKGPWLPASSYGSICVSLTYRVHGLMEASEAGTCCLLLRGSREEALVALSLLIMRPRLDITPHTLVQPMALTIPIPEETAFLTAFPNIQASYDLGFPGF